MEQIVSFTESTKTALTLWAVKQKSVDTKLFVLYYISCVLRIFGGVAQLARAYGSYP